MSRASISYDLDMQVGIQETSVLSVDFHVLAKNANGVLLAWADASAVAGLSAARVASGSPAIAPGALVILTRASTTQPLAINVAAVGSINFALASAVFGD